jgi:hypothetical protein
MQYKLVTSDKPDVLESLVNILIESGWRPLGGVCVSLSESDDYRYMVFAQAMVRDSG